MWWASSFFLSILCQKSTARENKATAETASNAASFLIFLDHFESLPARISVLFQSDKNKQEMRCAPLNGMFAAHGLSTATTSAQRSMTTAQRCAFSKGGWCAIPAHNPPALAKASGYITKRKHCRIEQVCSAVRWPLPDCYVLA